MKKDDVKVYDKPTRYGKHKRYTMKNGKVVKIQSLDNRGRVVATDLSDFEEDNEPIIRDYKDYDICGNCGNELGKNDKYCQCCGTKKGKGDFLPFLNETYFVYGPPISYYYKCKKCNHKWKVRTLGGLNESNYCPNCGSKHIENTDTKDEFSK